MANGAARVADDMSITSGDATAGNPRFDSTYFGSVPRDLVRAAEWLVRHDAAGGPSVAEFDSCCSATWDPTRPGVVTMFWTRPCATALAPAGQELADTGECLDRLTIVVDVGRATVVSIDRLLGPQGG